MADIAVPLVRTVPAVPPALTDIEIKNSRNRKYPRGTDFTGRKLIHADFRGATLVECIFDDADCKYANFESANCWGCSFVGTNMHRANIANACFENVDFRPRDCFGLTITLHCRTFSGWRVDHEIMKLWFFMPTTWKLPEVKGAPDYWKSKIIAAIGEDRLNKYRMLFQTRQI